MIVLSLCRANAENQIGFVVDWRRTNVSLTRARLALFVVCNAETLCSDPLWHEYFAFHRRSVRCWDAATGQPVAAPAPWLDALCAGGSHPPVEPPGPSDPAPVPALPPAKSGGAHSPSGPPHVSPLPPPAVNPLPPPAVKRDPHGRDASCGAPQDPDPRCHARPDADPKPAVHHRTSTNIGTKKYTFSFKKPQPKHPTKAEARAEVNVEAGAQGHPQGNGPPDRHAPPGVVPHAPPDGPATAAAQAPHGAAALQAWGPGAYPIAAAPGAPPPQWGPYAGSHPPRGHQTAVAPGPPPEAAGPLHGTALPPPPPFQHQMFAPGPTGTNAQFAGPSATYAAATAACAPAPGPPQPYLAAPPPPMPHAPGPHPAAPAAPQHEISAHARSCAEDPAAKRPRTCGTGAPVPWLHAAASTPYMAPPPPQMPASAPSLGHPAPFPLPPPPPAAYPAAPAFPPPNPPGLPPW